MTSKSLDLVIHVVIIIDIPDIFYKNNNRETTYFCVLAIFRKANIIIYFKNYNVTIILIIMLNCVLGRSFFVWILEMVCQNYEK